MFNQAAVDFADTARSVSANTHLNSLLAVEREVAPRKAGVDGDRLDALADRIAMHIESLVPRGRAHCVELAGDLTLAETIQPRMPRTDWRCIDIGRAPSGRLNDTRWSESRAGDGTATPYADGEFDVALLSDVLHRVSPEDAARLLAEAARVARRVLVKDRFEHSRTTPSLAALIGNRVPRDFTREAFVRLAAEQRLVITALDCDLARTLRGTDWQFIAALCRV